MTVNFLLGQNNSTANQNVVVLNDAFEMASLDTTRRIWIYLPADYQSSQEKYPVLYMHDGQNLFDDETSYVGEWGVDESLDNLAIDENINLIVVGIDNGGIQRMDEYTPWLLKNYDSKPKGEAYINFIVQSLKPYIDNHFRTLPGNENTGIMGSSLGGLISHYAVLKHPNIFGKAGIFSPSFEMAPDSFQFTEAHCKNVNSMLYFMAGDSESGEMAPLMLKMVDKLHECGYPAANIYSKVVEGGEHNEKLWRDGFKDAIRWLYGKNNN
ncbi:alpha/beta hydrolase-fold protein [Lutimonas halocynthiae]|uniref:alpha/beta hydrolase n=1 Tax=Lutimonas halocynthiae TaxID=1446477 RepID=UPI0025B5F286|nr:alpha/beta hydrolase-fold protein [Lutimonas halocynthiae]MDN3641198.1 alpha/beta hydrolase-fold protein [Lutimonas halocynthiae]